MDKNTCILTTHKIPVLFIDIRTIESAITLNSFINIVELSEIISLL